MAQPSSHLPVPLSYKAPAWQGQPLHAAPLLAQERAVSIHPPHVQAAEWGPVGRPRRNSDRSPDRERESQS